VHARWFSPEIGGRRVVDVDGAPIDRIFGRMRTAGLSASRLHDARNLYQPSFRWAKRRRIIRRSPMVDFELPISSHVTTEHTPPEVDQLCLYLQLLEPLVRRVVVSSPRKTRVIAEAKVKSDKVDARNLGCQGCPGSRACLRSSGGWMAPERVWPPIPTAAASARLFGGGGVRRGE
jgi:hypothetical protein